MPIFRKSEGRRVLELPISAISPNPHQPRQVFGQEELESLAASIAQLGILQPLTVRRCGGQWELIAGERRLRAAALAGLSTVPCLEVQADNSASSLLALVENIQRKDLDFLEEARALRHLMDTYGLSQEETAAKVGKSQPAVANKLRLLRLPEDVLELLRREGFGERHARALLALDDPELQRKAAQHTVRHHLTVARTEEYVAKLLAPPPHPPAPIYKLRDIRLFLNTVQKGLAIMNSAGVAAHCGREESDREILLTIRIPKHAPSAPPPPG